MVAKLPPGFVRAEGFDITSDTVLFYEARFH
jgi:hypothetical protein